MSSIILCGQAVPGPPPLHGGTVVVQSTAKLTTNNISVLLKRSIENKTVPDCSTPTDTNTGTFPCSKVNSVTAGESTKLTVEGKNVILETLVGTTNGNPIGSLFIEDVKQDKLTTI